MAFEAFKKPSPVSFEVEGATFTFELPTRWHRGWTRGWQEAIATKMKVRGDGTVDQSSIRASELEDAQIGAFVEHCFIDGPLDGASLLDEYYPLLEIIFKQAQEQANDVEAKAEAAVGKSLPTSSGKKGGAAKPASTASSKLKVA